MAVSGTHRGWLLKHNEGLLAAVYNGALPGTTALSANTALNGVLLGTPVAPALAVDSIVISNMVASGDFLLVLNRGGNSENYLHADGSAGSLSLYAPNGAITLTPTTDVVLANGTGLTVGHTSQETISTGDGATDLIPEVQIMGTAQADSTLMLAQFNATNGQAAMIALVKGGNAAIGTHTTVADDEYLGRIVAFADDGTDLETPSAEIRFVVDGTPAGSQVGGSIEFLTTPDGSTTLTAVMTLNSAQNVVISDGNGLLVGSATPLTAGAASEFQVLGTALADGSAILALFAASALAPDLQFVKGRGATIGSLTIVNDNDEVGRIVWLPADGADLATEAAVFQAEVDDASPAAGDIGMAFVWESMAGGGAAIAERMRLSAAGDLSIANGGGVIIGTAAQVAAAGVTSELQIHGTAPADSTMLLGAWSADTAAPRVYFGKSRSATIGTFSIITTGDVLGQIVAYGDDGVDFNTNTGNPSAEIRFLSSGTIAADRVPGEIGFYTATDAQPSVSTLRLTINNAGLITVASGNITLSAAGDLGIPAATAAAWEVSDGTTKFYAVDTRVAVTGVTTHAFDISDYTLASAAGAVATGVSVAAHTLNLTGNTQVTSAANTVSLGARTIAADGVPGACTVDQANTLTLVAPVEGSNVTLTDTSAIRITDAAGTPTNQYGIYIESLAGGTTANRGIYLAGANGIQFGVADDIIFPAATAAALELSDGTTKFLAFDTRATTVGVTSIAFDIGDYTLASAAGAVATGLSLAAHTLNLTGNTQVTTQVDTVVLGARTIAADGVGGACTVDEASSLLLVAPTEGTNVTLTAAAALRILDAAGTPTNQYGIYIEAQSGGTTQNYAIYSAGGRNELLNSFTGDGRVLKLSSTMTDGNNTDGYGVFEVDVTAAGTVAGTVAASSTWLNFAAAAVPGSNLICAQNNGIWLASGITATNATMIIGMRMQYVPNDGADCSNLYCFDTNIYDNVLKAIFRVNALGDLGGSTGAQTGNDYKVPIFHDVTANQTWYVNVYHT